MVWYFAPYAALASTLSHVAFCLFPRGALHYEVIRMTTRTNDAARYNPPLDALAGEQRSSAMALERLLHEVFGHQSFRPHQREVCTHIAAGHSALVVMPTGAGKSLCYQLPGLALGRERGGGCTLVLSPLIALMEDQVAALKNLGLRAERIHSGRPREALRAASRLYLDDDLDFLFIAPERLGVPGFARMLGKRQPSLVCVDEAHCISQWGHDFRPDYRMIGERLLREVQAPLVALTATATPTVQDDIITQLSHPITDADPVTHNSADDLDLRRFVYGFRRHNLAIEVTELLPSARFAAIAQVLKDPAQRPAIVYTPSRKDSETLAAQLAQHFSCAPYHAGLRADRRDQVQQQFLSGEVQVIVATIAFGMGIDKANVRSVIHSALPASVEGYYQEIGRAGRDGLPARAMLFFGYSDRRTHDFFLARDYPEVDVLQKFARALSDVPQAQEDLRQRLKLDEDVFAKAMEKLWIHGGLRFDDNEGLLVGPSPWRAAYQAQRRHKQKQLEDILRFAQSSGCRMRHLVKHFGDQEDSGAACGLCDYCAPEASLCSQSTEASPKQREHLAAILRLIDADGPLGMGRLHNTLSAQLSRPDIDTLLGALEREGLIDVDDAQFVKDGETIRYRRVEITDRGRASVRQGASTLFSTLRLRRNAPQPRSSSRKRRRKQARVELPPPSPILLDALQAWRSQTAKRLGTPAFFVLSNKTLKLIASARPQDEDALFALAGLGEKKVGQFGRELLALVSKHS